MIFLLNLEEISIFESISIDLIYYQLIFLLNLEEISRFERISIDIYFQLIFFKPRRNLKIRKNFNWYQYIFNCFFLNLEEISRFERISIDINLFSIDFPFKPGRNFKIHKDFQLISIDFPFAPRRNLKISKDFNWYQSTLNWISFYCKPKRNLKGPRGLIN